MGPPTLTVPDVLGLGSLVKFSASVFGIAGLEHFTLDVPFWFLVSYFFLVSVFCAESLRICSLVFFKRLPAMYGGTNFLFFLGWTTVVMVLFVPLFSLVGDLLQTQNKSHVLVGLALYLDDTLGCLLPAALFRLQYPAGYFQSSALE